MDGVATDLAPDPRTYDYSHPQLVCDMVMKGGITSGVVYPFAVCEIARSYRLKNVGGTSAGAIAAAAAAAAELGRHSPTGGFRALAELPSWLGADANLLNLFQPQPATRPLYRVFAAPIGRRHARAAATVAAAVTAFWGWALAGCAPGVALLVLAFTVWHGVARGAALGLGAVLVLLGGVVAIVFGLVRTAVNAVPNNGFGLCSGFRGQGEGAPSRNAAPPLTDWLADEVDRLAGNPDSTEPLTFGDLWRGPDGLGGAEDRVIDLQMMTTNLTQGRPYRLPLDSAAWFFDPATWRTLFPERIVRWMEEHPPPAPEAERDRRWWELLCHLLEPLRPLPDAAQVPVVVATRMSLSFPLLVSAIPLFAVDWSREANQEARRAWGAWLREHEPNREAEDGVGWDATGAPPIRPHATVCWFSDGGISSNFPVHFFDSPIPRWPTFALNLRPFHPDHPQRPDECENVYVAATNLGGIAEQWERFPERGLGALVAFGHSIVDTMQNWTDNTQLRVPGYRDRVAHVELTADEGGINLNMPAERIAALSERGRCAGQLLATRFGPSPPQGTSLTWDNHRWVRYRSMMALIQDQLDRFRRGYEWPGPAGSLSYHDLIERDSVTPPNSYRWETVGQMVFALGATQDLVGLSSSWDGEPDRFSDGSPRPEPELRVRPRV